jgi:regulator of sigma E protease
MGGAALDFAGWALLAQSDAAADAPGLMTVVVTQVWLWLRVAIGIGLVIFVHELGHFLAAKWCGVKVEKFYVGFDVPIRIGPIRFPRTLGKFRYGETEYGIGTIPLGGYVKMLGQDDDPRRMEEEARRIRQESGDEAAGDEAESDRPVKLDPRSFPAKTVWQRMLIISSGVVMNLITGVMFAAAAFLYGVPYLPAIVGDVTPGSPAFEAGIRPGGKVVGVGGISKDNHLYFTDMATAIMLEGTSNPEQPVSVAIEYPDGIRNYELRTAEVAAVPGLRRIGISNITTNFLPTNQKRLAATDSAAASVLTEADAGAEVITIDGQPVVGVGNRDNVPGSVMVQQRIAARPNHPVTLGLLRADGSTAEVVVPPQPMNMPGMELAIGPVNGIVAGGPAANAGVKRGDVLVAVDGETRIGAFSLPSLLADVDRPVKMTFRRTDGAESTETELELTPVAPSRTSSPFNTMDNSIALDRFGLSYQALPKVAFVDDAADGQSPWRAGDVVKKVAVKWPGGVVPEAFSDQVFAPLRKRLAEGWEFNNEYTLSTCGSSFPTERSCP